MVWYVQRLVEQNVAEAKDLVLFLLRQVPGTFSRAYIAASCNSSAHILSVTAEP